MGNLYGVGIGLALASALSYAVAYVLQYREASNAPEELSLSPRLLVHLARRPWWLAGVLAFVVGAVTQTVALATASLALVEPILVTTLLFALPFGAALSHQRLQRNEWLAAVAASAGVAALVVAAGSGGSHTVGSGLSWLLAASGIAVVIGLLTLAGRGRSAQIQAATLSMGAGILWGASDALTKSAFRLADQGGMWKLFLSWELYALVVVSLVALLWTQSAYEHAPLPASLPGLVILEPVAGVLLGAAVLHVTFRTGPMWSSIEGLGAAITIAGAYVLARSPLAVGADRVEMTDERRDADHRRSAAS